MTTIDITKTFQVTAGVPNEVKVEILRLFFDTSVTNIQSIFAALTERSPLARLMFNDIDSGKYTSHLEQIVQKMTGGDSESLLYKLTGIACTCRKLHSSYAGGKTIREKEFTWQ